MREVAAEIIIIVRLVLANGFLAMAELAKLWRGRTTPSGPDSQD